MFYKLKWIFWVDNATSNAPLKKRPEKNIFFHAQTFKKISSSVFDWLESFIVTFCVPHLNQLIPWSIINSLSELGHLSVKLLQIAMEKYINHVIVKDINTFNLLSSSNMVQ